MAILQVEIEDSLKNDVIPIFNNLGIDISTAVKIFLKRVVICNGLPFRMTLPKETYSAERGYRALLEISEESERKGLSEMSLDEINAEIEAVRKQQ